MQVKIGSTALGINWVISIQELSIVLSKAENIDNIDKLMMAIAPLHEKLNGWGTPFNQQQNLAAALVDALRKWEGATAVEAMPNLPKPAGAISLNIKQSETGVILSAQIGGSSNATTTACNEREARLFVDHVFDVVDQDGNQAGQNTKEEMLEVIMGEVNRWWMGKAILGGRSVDQAASENFGKFTATYCQDSLNKANAKEDEARKRQAINDEIEHRSPNSFHELAMRAGEQGQLERFSYKGKVVLARGLNIGDAIQALEDGWKVTCEHWPKHVYLFMAHCDNVNGFDDFIAMHTSQGDNSPWSPTQKSLVDRTWCILA